MLAWKKNNLRRTHTDTHACNCEYALIARHAGTFKALMIYIPYAYVEFVLISGEGQSKNNKENNRISKCL